jgi:hypothetical protein
LLGAAVPFVVESIVELIPAGVGRAGHEVPRSPIGRRPLRSSGHTPISASRRLRRAQRTRTLDG